MLWLSNSTRHPRFAHYIVSCVQMSRTPVIAGVQQHAVLDELCYYNGPLGASLSQEEVSIAVWAPTACQVGPTCSSM